MKHLALILLAGLLLPTGPAAAQDTKSAADGLVHLLRASQRDDGLYGNGLPDTQRALDLLARSPRRYGELDGPFVRVPLRAVADAPHAPEQAARVALALAGGLSGPVVAAREAALAEVAAGPAGDLYEWALAVRTWSLPDVPLPEPPEGADAGLACLLAADPASVPPPPLEPVATWTRWARAARLRGVVPGALPPVPAPEPGLEFGQVLDRLETVIAMHGLAQPPAGAPATRPELPGFVPQGQDLQAAVTRAWEFLQAHQQNGTFGLELPGWDGPEAGVTALSLSASIYCASRLGLKRPAWIDQGLDWLLALQRDNGAIEQHGLDVYTTSAALGALIDARRPGDAAAIARARDFLVSAQADEGEGYSPGEDPYYGGIGYGNDERPDLSNTQMALEAVREAGLEWRDPFYAKALLFVEKCQNLGEQSPREWPRQGGGRIVSGTDGGGTYMPGNSEFGEVDLGDGNWSPRSYGSMTYALVKSYVLCGARRDDPRVVAAIAWLAGNFSLDENPGSAPPGASREGLYYYYLAMARTLSLLAPDGFRDADGQPIPWREQLERRLLDLQRTDGSWINADSPRWWEGAPPLATAYALLALQATRG